jgi:hypothetical protein
MTAPENIAALIARVRKVAEGGTINGSYGMLPGEALAAFRSDLIALLEALERSLGGREDIALAAAKIVDPDAWHHTLPQDGCGQHWSGRRNKALSKADRILALRPQPSTAPGEECAIEHHGDWVIWHQPWPIDNREFDWHFAHKSATESNGLSGNAESRDMCLQAIDWLEEQERHAETEEGKAETAAFVDAGMRTLNRALLASAVKGLLDLPGIGNLPGFATGTHLEAARFALEQYEEQTR